MKKEKIEAAIEQMEKKLKEYIENGKYAHYEESFLLSAGKEEGMEEALKILKEVME